MRNLKNKRVLITGAGRGIGRAIALRMAHEGARLIVTDVQLDLLAELVAQLQSENMTAQAYALDVTQPEQIAALHQRLRDEGGPIDVLVNNAGTVHGGALLDVPWEKHRLTYEVNTLGVVAMTHEFLPDLLAQSEGHLVTIASASGFVGLPFGSTYASSKWAAVGFSESVRLELEVLGHRHVRVTTVCPSYVNTELFAGARAPRLTRVLQPEALAERVVSGVLRDRPFVLAPRMVRLLPLLRGVLPLASFDRVCRRLGATTSMREWRGRV